jgi:acyl carrier protein
MKEKIRNIMASVFEMDEKQLKENFAQKDVEAWDSLRHLNLVVELEEAFSISYEPEEIAEMTSFDKVLSVTKTKSGENG